MERNIVWLGEDDNDGGMDDVHPFFGDPKVAKELLDKYLAETPEKDWDYSKFVNVLSNSGFITVIAGLDMEEFDAAVTADKLHDLIFPNTGGK
jgi:hypothetical protein